MIRYLRNWLRLACPAILAILVSSGSAVVASNGDMPSIQRLLKNLDAPGFGERQESSNALRAMGANAFPSLVAAAKTGNREVVTRIIDILSFHLEGGDDPTKTAARKSLEELAQGEGAAAPLAARILNPPKPAQPMDDVQPMPAQRHVRVKVTVVNGVKDIDVNDDGLKVKIHEAPGTLEVSVEKPVEGNRQVTKYAAKDADELKLQSPEGYEFYKRYSEHGGPVMNRIRFQGLPVPVMPPRFLPFQPPQPDPFRELRKVRIH